MANDSLRKCALDRPWKVLSLCEIDQVPRTPTSRTPTRLRRKIFLVFVEMYTNGETLSMMPEPAEFRPVLLDLLDALRRVARIYRSSILHAPVFIEAPGWDNLCVLAERTANQTRVILDDTRHLQDRDCELRLSPPSVSATLGEKMRARRALQMSPSPQHGCAPRKGLHH